MFSNKGNAKGKAKDTDTDDDSEGFGSKDASKGKRAADVVDEYWHGIGKDWVLQHKALLDVKIKMDAYDPEVPKGGPAMQQIYAFNTKSGLQGPDLFGSVGPVYGTDVFFSHQHIKSENSWDGFTHTFFEAWWSPHPKTSWLTTWPHQWVYMGRVLWNERDGFDPPIWGKYGSAVRILRGQQ